MPSRPANGARMVFFSIVARMASALAWVCFRVASAVIQFRLRDRVVARGAAGAFGIDAGEIALAPRGPAIALLPTRCPAAQQIAFGHDGAGFKGDLAHRARQLRG